MKVLEIAVQLMVAALQGGLDTMSPEDAIAAAQELVRLAAKKD